MGQRCQIRRQRRTGNCCRRQIHMPKPSMMGGITIQKRQHIMIDRLPPCSVHVSRQIMIFVLRLFLSLSLSFDDVLMRWKQRPDSALCCSAFFCCLWLTSRRSEAARKFSCPLDWPAQGSRWGFFSFLFWKRRWHGLCQTKRDYSRPFIDDATSFAQNMFCLMSKASSWRDMASTNFRVVQKLRLWFWQSDGN